MYKLVIVDDETIIRKGICEFINWREMGFELAAAFDDGKETIEYLKNNSVDVVLTDIKMAEISGLEIAKYIYEKKLKIKTVILSGYKEFEYARRAVEYEVEHYLLKPVKLDEVSMVFEKIKRKLNELDEKEKKNQEERAKYIELLPQLQEQFFASLIMGALRKEEEIVKRIGMLDLKIDPNQHPCLLIDVRLRDHTRFLDSKGQYKKEKVSNLIFNIFREEKNSMRFFPTHLSGDIIKVVCVSSRQETSEAFIQQTCRYLEELNKLVRSTLGLKLETLIEKSFTNLIELSNYEKPFQLHFRQGDPQQHLELLSEDYERLMQKYKLLISSINDGDFEEVDSLAENIFHECRGFPVMQVQQMCIDLFSMISNKFLQLGVDLWKFIREKVDYQKILNVNDHEELRLLCRNILREVIVVVKNQKNSTSKELVKQAVKYIKENYHTDISMEELSDRLFLNPAYFSRLFKQSLGDTFTNYLIKVRMEKAMELLQCGRYKVYEVSEKVGYKSEKYFFRIFRQYTGYSPTEYCRNMMRGSENYHEET